MSFGAPSFGAPSFGQSSFGAPSFGTPAFGAPAFGSSAFGANPSKPSATQPLQVASSTSPKPSHPLPQGDLIEVQTEAIGFTSIDGESRLQLAGAWPKDNPPPSTSSLLSVTSEKGLLAAAGPDGVVVARCRTVRDALRSPISGSSEKPFSPELRIPMPFRVSHVAFSSDGSFLVVSAEQGGGLAVYETQSLMLGKTNTALEIGTEGNSLRSLLPNSSRELSHMVACVTHQGNLLVADLKQGSFSRGSGNSTLLKEVSSVTWSPKGKQLLAGLGNGRSIQLTPSGDVKAELPRPPGMASNEHVSSLIWLQNDVFIIVTSPWTTHHPGSTAEISPSSYYLVTRSGEQYAHQKLVDPCPPFGVPRMPAKHFMTRMQNAPPNLDDVLVMASTVSTDISLVIKSRTPLSSDATGTEAVNNYVTAFMAEDSRRAQMPTTSGFQDTSPVGAALDLSSEENAPRPIPGDELDESITPLPAYYVLNTEGVLVGWWLVYNEAVRAGIRYPGTMSTSTIGQPVSATAPAPSNSFGGVANPSPFATHGVSAFGQLGALGSKASPWSTAGSQKSATSAVPAFGSTSGLGGHAQMTFGAASAFGSGKSPWATAGSAASIGDSAPQSRPVETSAPNFSSSSGGFASHASSGGFAAMSNAGPVKSIFSSTTPSAEPAAPKTSSLWGGVAESKGFDMAGGFKLTSAFKPDRTDETTAGKPGGESTSAPGMFGSSFSRALGQAGTDSQPPKLASVKPESPPAPQAEAGKKAVPAAGIEERPAVVEPEAPLPPDPSSKAIYGPGDSSGSSIQDVPLPPEESAAPKSTKASGLSSEGTTLSREGSGELVYPPTESSNSILSEKPKQDTTPSQALSRLDSTTPQESPHNSNSFTGSFEEIERSPSMERAEAAQARGKAVRKPLFGEVGQSTTPFLPPPQPVIFDSPRSPSPVRTQGRGDANGEPSAAQAQALLKRHYLDRADSRSPTIDQETPPSGYRTDRIVPGAYLAQSVERPGSRNASAPPPRNEEAYQLPEDDEDRLVKAELESELVATRDLAPFQAHHDYVGHISKEGIPGQIERVCRDVTSMIDTIGLNARSITAWTEGHQQYKDGGRSLEDLQLVREDDWVMIEVSDLGVLIDADVARGIQEHVDPGWQNRVLELREVETDLVDMTKRAARFKSRFSGTDEEDESTRHRRSEAGQARNVHSAGLRNGLQNLHSLLVETEQNIAMLQAKLTSAQTTGSASAQGKPERAVPSMDAVVRTISKMMNMIETKSTDIDLLEQHMRSLDIDNLTLGNDGQNDDAGSGRRFASSFRSSHGGSGSSKLAGSRLHGASPGRDVENGSAVFRPDAEKVRRTQKRRNKQRKGLQILRRIIQESPVEDTAVKRPASV